MKITPLARLLTGFLSYFTHNSNADKIEEAFQNTVSRDGSSPNQMEAVLDMNSNRIINLGAPKDPTDAVRLQDVTGDAVITVSEDWNDLTNKPTTFAPSAHTHPESDITGLATDLAGKAPTVHTHTTGQVTGLDAEIDNRVINHTLLAGSNVTFVPIGTDQLRIDASATGSTAWSSLTGVPSTFTPSAHTHPESDVTSLVSDLAGKANTSHSHSTSDITSFNSSVRGLFSASGPGLSYNSGTGVFTSSGGGGSLPNGMYPAWENGITTGTSAATNTANLNSLINTISGLGGGTIWFFTAGPYQFNGTINLKPFVSIIMSPGAVLTWVGAAGGVCFSSSITDVLVHCKYEINVDEGTGFSGTVFNLHSCQYNDMSVTAIGANSGSTFVFMAADSTAGEYPWGGRNTVFNRFHFEHRGRCQYGIIIQGITLGFGGQAQGVTDNEFYSCQFANITFRAIKINEWSDSNTWTGNTYAGLSGSGSIGLVVNEGHTNNYSVYNHHFQHLAFDTFGTGLSRTGVVLFESKMMFCEEYFNDPEAENGAFLARVPGHECLSYRWSMCTPATNNIAEHTFGFTSVSP
jgi:hypothetical protein